MPDHPTKRPEMEQRRASDSVANSGTQTEDDRVSGGQDTSLTRAQSLDRQRQLAQRPPARDAQVTRRPDEEMAPQHDSDRRGAPAVRLDMDLDVDITMKAKIKGVIELSILDSEQSNQQRQPRQP
ncbi:uncharacterized protein B0H64DRAFT_442847 [Chaetomium fimeti]|uniref:Uncharacterized protein n=1 Tax=Chaetomium fimeti TaxID=1854472 RepID=A0AAE0LTB2_9PEZI|nr:hypothetical protein B0H64DRAFT_442847 [Chaetomium fimeti]